MTTKKTKEETHKFNNQEILDAHNAITYLASERSYVDTDVKVDIGVLLRTFKPFSEAVNDAILDLHEEHGEGEEGARVVKNNTPAARKFNRAMRTLMSSGEKEITFKPLELSRLKVKRRNEEGERVDEIIELTPDEIVKLGPVLKISRNQDG